MNIIYMHVMFIRIVVIMRRKMELYVNLSMKSIEYVNARKIISSIQLIQHVVNDYVYLSNLYFYFNS